MRHQVSPLPFRPCSYRAGIIRSKHTSVRGAVRRCQCRAARQLHSTCHACGTSTSKPSVLLRRELLSRLRTPQHMPCPARYHTAQPPGTPAPACRCDVSQYRGRHHRKQTQGSSTIGFLAVSAGVNEPNLSRPVRWRRSAALGDALSPDAGKRNPDPTPDLSQVCAEHAALRGDGGRHEHPRVLHVRAVCAQHVTVDAGLRACVWHLSLSLNGCE
jgi:hypothetical protein